MPVVSFPSIGNEEQFWLLRTVPFCSKKPDPIPNLVELVDVVLALHLGVTLLPQKFLSFHGLEV